MGEKFLITRRQFHRLLGAAGLGIAALANGCASWIKRDVESLRRLGVGPEPDTQKSYDYIVVGAGAGGGPLAARLAAAGYTVLLLEAGGDPLDLSDARLPEDYSIPAFHAFASENPAMRWDFFVRHYADEDQQKLDPKFRSRGILYPRAAGLGGCTAHNAMIFIYPHNDDWNYIAELTADPSWKAENMRQYFERLEDCRHRPGYRLLHSLFGANPTRHGFDGWLSTERSDPSLALGDRDMLGFIMKSALKAFADMGDPLTQLEWAVESKHDPNDWRLVEDNAYGLRYTPITTRDHARVGSRERILDAARRFPAKLHIETDALASRVLFDDSNRAIGVEYLKGERLYRAHANPSQDPGEKREAFAAREVVLCGGAFNTPQLLMLSGIGPREVLERHGIKVRLDFPSVGRNLQDRYEVSVVNRMKEDWKALAGARFEKDDAQSSEWRSNGSGVYATNGGALIVVKKSRAERKLPDLVCLGLLANFQGYFPGYSEWIARDHNYLSWVVLKAHTINNAGSVSIQSADPRDPPKINFRYFEEGSDKNQEDLAAVVEGVKFVRAMTANLRMDEAIVEEVLPGEKVQKDDELKDFVRNNAWGHHASCTCPIGPKENGGVLGSDFRVHGTEGLRVVDASVFPRIPGSFIVSSVYMISEKAADVILADAAKKR